MCMTTHLGLFYNGEPMGWHMPNGSYGEAMVSMGVGAVMCFSISFCAFVCLFVLDCAYLCLIELVYA